MKVHDVTGYLRKIVSKELAEMLKMGAIKESFGAALSLGLCVLDPNAGSTTSTTSHSTTPGSTTTAGSKMTAQSTMTGSTTTPISTTTGTTTTQVT